MISFRNVELDREYITQNHRHIDIWFYRRRQWSQVHNGYETHTPVFLIRILRKLKLVSMNLRSFLEQQTSNTSLQEPELKYKSLLCLKTNFLVLN